MRLGHESTALENTPLSGVFGDVCHACNGLEGANVSFSNAHGIHVMADRPLLADLLYNLSVYGLQFLLRGRLGLGTYLYRIIIPEMFYTVFITLIVYRIFRYINYHYMNITRKESESIWVLK